MTRSAGPSQPTGKPVSESLFSDPLPMEQVFRVKRKYLSLHSKTHPRTLSFAAARPTLQTSQRISRMSSLSGARGESTLDSPYLVGGWKRPLRDAICTSMSKKSIKSETRPRFEHEFKNLKCMLVNASSELETFELILREIYLHCLIEGFLPDLAKRIRIFEVQPSTNFSTNYIHLWILLNKISAAQGVEKEVNLGGVVHCVRRSVVDQYSLKVAEFYPMTGARPSLRTQPLQSCMKYSKELSLASPWPKSDPPKDGPRLSYIRPRILSLAYVVIIRASRKTATRTRWAMPWP